MEVLKVFLVYAGLALIGVLVAKLLITFLLRRLATPERPERESLAECAAKSLKMATELRIDATAVYRQLSGEGHPR